MLTLASSFQRSCILILGLLSTRMKNYFSECSHPRSRCIPISFTLDKERDQFLEPLNSLPVSLYTLYLILTPSLPPHPFFPYLLSIFPSQPCHQTSLPHPFILPFLPSTNVYHPCRNIICVTYHQEKRKSIFNLSSSQVKASKYQRLS